MRCLDFQEKEAASKTDNKKTRLTTVVYKGEMKAHSNHRDKPLPLKELNDDTDDKLTLLL